MLSGSILTGGNILSLDILFSHRKASDANIGIIANFVQSVKNSIIVSFQCAQRG